MLQWIPRWLRWAFAVLVVGLIVRYALLPNVSDIQSGVERLDRISPLLLLLGVVLTAASIASEAELTRASLAREHRPGVLDMLRLELAATALSHTVPGGTAAGTALAFRVLRQAEVPAPEAGLALAVRGLGSAAVLNVLLAVALLVSIPMHGASPEFVTAAALGGAVLVTVAGASALLVRREDQTSDALCHLAARVPFVDEEAIHRGTHRVAQRLRELLDDRRLAARAVGWSAAYWLFAAASLLVFCRAFGADVDPVSLFVAFGVANVLAAIPVTPQGLGVVEGVMIPLLTAFGSGAEAAALGVITWRLVSFWAPIPLGAASYMSLRVAAFKTGTTRADVLRGLAETGRRDAERLARWAERHGINVGPNRAHARSATDQDHATR